MIFGENDHKKNEVELFIKQMGEICIGETATGRRNAEWILGSSILLFQIYVIIAKETILNVI